MDATKFAAAYGTWILQNNTNNQPLIVIGRDARISGEMISDLVIRTLQGLGINVIDLGLSTTQRLKLLFQWKMHKVELLSLLAIILKNGMHLNF